MTYQEALQAVLIGGTIRRKAWNGEKELRLSDPNKHDSSAKIVRIQHPEYHPKEGLLIECRLLPAWLGMEGRYSEQRYWDGTPKDTEADDWECRPVTGIWVEDV